MSDTPKKYATGRLVSMLLRIIGWLVVAAGVMVAVAALWNPDAAVEGADGLSVVVTIYGAAAGLVVIAIGLFVVQSTHLAIATYDMALGNRPRAANEQPAVSAAAARPIRAEPTLRKPAP